jgi:hypothetical protein
MATDWQAVNRVLFPIKGYEDACRRCKESFSYPFVRDTFNFTMPELITYTRLGVGSDPRKRYEKYSAILLDTLDQLQHAGISNLLDLIKHLGARAELEQFAAESKVEAEDIAEVLKYLIYWVIPMNKYLSGLVKPGSHTNEALKVLRGVGIRTNLDLLGCAITAADRKALTKESGLPLELITELVNVADFSRMPWASKATISNIMGAGYCSLARLANADPERLYADFFLYGEMIGKNLKLGNEIQNSHRIAKILPLILQEA